MGNGQSQPKQGSADNGESNDKVSVAHFYNLVNYATMIYIHSSSVDGKCLLKLAVALSIGQLLEFDLEFT
jgi:hypothetical protein